MRRHEWLIILFLAVCAANFCIELLIPFDRVVFEETYLQFIAHQEAIRSHLLKDFKLLTWSFHFGGGFPVIKHPEDMALSPFFYMFMVPFGTAIGFKLFFLFCYFIGCVGMFLFVTRTLNWSRESGMISAMYFIFGGFIPFQISTGNINAPLLLFLPLLVYLFFQMKKASHAYGVLSSVILVIMVFSGIALYYPVIALLLFILTLFDRLQIPSLRLVNIKTLMAPFFLVFFCAFILGAIKFFPIVDIMIQNDRGFDLYQEIPIVAVSPRQLVVALLNGMPSQEGDVLGKTFYFGFVPITLFLLSGIANFKRIWPLITCGLFFLIVSMGPESPVDLFYVLWHLPFFHSVHEVSRYFMFPVIFIVSAVAGGVLTLPFKHRYSRLIKVLLAGISLFGAIHMFAVNRQYFHLVKERQIPHDLIKDENEFFNVQLIRTNIPNDNPWKIWDYDKFIELESLQYFLLSQNIGLINWSGGIHLAEKAVPKYKVIYGYGDYWRNLRDDMTIQNGVIPNESYKGEAYFLNATNNVKAIHWGTNEILVQLEQLTPDKLVINQNYDQDWESSDGNIFNYEGLIGVQLSEPRQGEIRLFYVPKSFIVGGIVSVLSVCVVIILLFLINKEKRFKRKKFLP